MNILEGLYRGLDSLMEAIDIVRILLADLIPAMNFGCVSNTDLFLANGFAFFAYTAFLIFKKRNLLQAVDIKLLHMMTARWGMLLAILALTLYELDQNSSSSIAFVLLPFLVILSVPIPEYLFVTRQAIQKWGKILLALSAFGILTYTISYAYEPETLDWCISSDGSGIEAPSPQRLEVRAE